MFKTFAGLKALAAAGFIGSALFLVPASTGPPPFGGPRQVRFVNEGRQPIAQLHVSAVGAGDWQGDLLGADYLVPGGSLRVAIDDPNQSCRIDVKIVRNDGSELVGRSVAICGSAGAGVGLR